MTLTLDEIRRRELEALCRELGRAGMIRFMRQFDTGCGDYAHERRSWVDQTALDDIREASTRKRSRKK